MFKEGYVRMKLYKYFNLIVASLDLLSVLYIVYYIYFPKNEELYTYVFLICILYVVIASNGMNLRSILRFMFFSFLHPFF